MKSALAQKNGAKRRITVAIEDDDETGRNLLNIVGWPKHPPEKIVDEDHMMDVTIQLFETRGIGSKGVMDETIAEVKKFLAEVFTLHDCEPWPNLNAAVLRSKIAEAKDKKHRDDEDGLRTDVCAALAIDVYQYLQHMAAETQHRKSTRQSKKP